jgi:acyl-CoA synthetase (AMP-forming)/AMP-acid ligase II
VALPNGSEAATLMVSVLCAGVCVPLNPALGRSASEALLQALHADTLVVPEHVDSAVVAVARSRGCALLRLASVADAPAGTIALRVETARTPVPRSVPSPDDLAIVFHTSGTTSRPKVVPVTHAQLLARSRAQPIDSSDRCLFVAPIFTSGAFSHSLLSPLAAGAAIGFARDAEADALLDALHQLSITYFAANPALLESLRERAARRGAMPPTLRYIRSSSIALPPEQQRRLEAAFDVPIVQAYGTSEAGTIAQNPLPPAPRKSGSVGISAGPEIAIVDEGGAFAGPNVAGEIVVRGPATMSGYESDPDADRRAFHEGWFRTGDSGHLDADGYLFITGRIKEIINRGGMKVAPAEIDEALLRHPAVADAAAFGMPHPTLGEDVGAAVVVREPATVSVQELRDFAFAHLAPHKVPSTIVRVPRLARTAAGKLNRSELANNLRASLRAGYVAPRDAHETLVAGIIAEVLHVERVGVDDNFFEIGGDSLRGAQVTSRVNAATGSSLGADALFRLPIVAHYAAALAADAASQLRPPPLAPRRAPVRGPED